ncbi:MAG: von Willebrand factor type A domain-containing protein [Ilumatobacteraceae bacterium]
MQYRTKVCFVALALLGAACGSDDRSSSSPDYNPPPVASRPVSTEAATEATWGSPETAPPDDEQLEPPDVNPVTDPREDSLSTFAMDVDTGSYTFARGSLQAGVVPDPSTVRTEEFVNYLDQDYAQPEDGPFAVTIDASRAPFLPSDRRVVRVGVQGRDVDDEARKDANLTFVIDISGSMADPGKLDAVRPALLALVESLRSTDRVGIVVYSDETRVLLGSTPVSEREAINDAIERLTPEGATFVEAGLRLGYEEAQVVYDPERTNRVVLLSDGVANVGETGPEGILSLIDEQAKQGIDLVTVGFGLGDYNDTLMEQLADQGNGFYAYVDSEGEAIRLFSHDLTGTLQTIAREAKAQVEFNPSTVRNYRLIGFENRQVADDDFRNDAVDGGEIGAGHTVTALYDVELFDDADDSDWVARATVRWLQPDTLDPSETGTDLLAGDLGDELTDAPLRLQQDVYVAAFAETLRGSGWAGEVTLGMIADELRAIGERLDDADVVEVADLVDVRRSLDR